MPVYFGLTLNIYELIRIINSSTLIDNYIQSFNRPIKDY